MPSRSRAQLQHDKFHHAGCIGIERRDIKRSTTTFDGGMLRYVTKARRCERRASGYPCCGGVMPSARSPEIGKRSRGFAI